MNAMNAPWKQANLYPNRETLETERLQCEDEGRDLTGVREEFERLLALELEDPAHWPDGFALLDKAIQLPMRADYPYREPSDLAGIRAERPPRPSLPSPAISPARRLDQIHGAWLGRCCGCLLGKPPEGWPRERIWGYLQAVGNWPLAGYFHLDAPAEVRERFSIVPGRAYIDEVECMPEDDDLNYTVIALAVMKRWGSEFTANDMATFWYDHLPMGHTWSAERVALRNLAMMIGPPQSALFRNPFREWIGAQIRADFFGYVAPGNPERAAEYAFRDASLTHCKNGIYGAMWVAAMLAAAAVTDDPRTILLAGLAQIPARCRLAEAIHEVLQWHGEGVAYDDAVERIHSHYNERRPHDLVHVISNAMIVAVGLLWGDLDFGRSICRAVQCGFDTDCNGATVGSIIGMILGAEKLPAAWTAPLHDTLLTGVAGYHRVAISALARETFEMIERFAAE